MSIEQLLQNRINELLTEKKEMQQEMRGLRLDLMTSRNHAKHLENLYRTTKAACEKLADSVEQYLARR